MLKRILVTCLVGLLAASGQALASDTVLSFDLVTGEAEATASGGYACGDGDVCGSSLTFLNDSVTVTANTRKDGSGTGKKLWYDLNPAQGGMGSFKYFYDFTDHAVGQSDWIIVEFDSEITLNGFWMNGDHAQMTSNTAYFYVGSTGGSQYSVTCDNNRFCDATVDSLTNPIAAGDRKGTRFAFSAASGVRFYLAGVLAGPPGCQVDTGTGECVGITKITLPVELAPGEFITQATETILDPRVDSNGRCIGPYTGIPNVDSQGNWTVRQSPDIIIPWWLCGSPNVALIDTQTIGFEVEFGAVIHDIPTGLPAGNDPSFKCDNYPLAEDLQKQTVFAWITDDPYTDPTKVIEERVLELTFECINPPRGKSGSLSILFAGLHIDFGVDPNDLTAVADAYQWLLIEKAGNLRTAVSNAISAGVISRPQVRSDLRNLARVIESKIKQGACVSASQKLEEFLFVLSRADIADGVPNYEGELVARAENMLFTNDVKFCPISKD